jgi:SSS family solute:Na+ symporter
LVVPDPGRGGGLGTLDWLIVAVYAAALLGIGFYYARRQKTTEEYFVANRSMRPILAGVSLFASVFSTITYIATPGELIQHGPAILLLNLAAVPFIYLVVGWVVIPRIMRLPVTSAYELLEARLGRGVRLIGSVTFVTTRMIWMALVLYTTATVLVRVMGWPPQWTLHVAILATTVTAVYTLLGGIEAVVLTDAVQFVVMFVPFGTAFGAVMGIIYSVATAVMIGYWDVFTDGPRLSFQLILPGALAVSLTASTLFSLLPTRGRSKLALAGFNAAALLPLAALLAWVSA